MRARTFLNLHLAGMLVTFIITATFLPWQLVTMIFGLTLIYMGNGLVDNWDEFKQDIKENRVITKEPGNSDG